MNTLKSGEPMKTLILLTVVSCTTIATGCAVRHSNARLADEARLLQLEDDWVEALVKDDAATLDRIVAPEFTFIEPDGTRKDRAAYLADRGKNTNDTDTFTNDELKVRLYGRFAVVSGHAHITESIEGKPHVYELRWQEIWRKTRGQWQVLCSQGTPVNPRWNAPFELAKTGS
jgi:ketosteroid isomerase-like protein